MENQSQIDLFIFIGILILICVAMLAAIIFIIYGRKIVEKESKVQLEIFRSVTESEEKQKEKIARNLHDEIIPILGAIEQSMDMNVKDFLIGQFDLERAKNDVEAIEKIKKEIRNISHDLVPGAILSLGLFGALEYYVNKLATSLTQVDFINQTSREQNAFFTLTDATHIYRMCLEILNNLKKHSGFKYLRVTIEIENSFLNIDFMHDGEAISNATIAELTESSIGLGLKSIQARALILNANINYSADAHVASVNLIIPIKVKNER